MQAMVLILDGNLEIDALEGCNNLCYFIRVRHLNRSKAVTNRIVFSEQTYFPSCFRDIF